MEEGDSMNLSLGEPLDPMAAMEEMQQPQLRPQKSMEEPDDSQDDYFERVRKEMQIARKKARETVNVEAMPEGIKRESFKSNQSRENVV